MASKIEWTEKTWNPLVGCTAVSSGCNNCYAERMARRQIKMGTKHYEGTIGGTGWTGDIGVAPESTWTKPLHWRKPSRIFVCSMGDLFHERVAYNTIDRVFAVIESCPQHTFQILTKRPEQMATYYATRRPNKQPPPNAHIGVTAENQEAADKRIPTLLKIPAAVRFVSIEPMVGPVNLFNAGAIKMVAPYNKAGREVAAMYACRVRQAKATIDWVICGGESGPGARPMHPKWARRIREQCEIAGIPFLFKQWGEWLPIDEGEEFICGGGGVGQKYYAANTGKEASLPMHLNSMSAHNDDSVSYYRVGKKAAGRLLDGKLHAEYPEAE